MSTGPDAARPGIGSQWIKANAIGGVLNAAVAFVAYLVGQALGVSEADAPGAIRAIFVVAATAALAFGIFVLGYLSAVVLRTKLPDFPMRSWLALYIVFGVIFGLTSALAWLTPETLPDTSLAEADIVIGLMVGAAIAGAALAAAVGSLQALILRPAAEGLGLWIACSTIAGALFLLIVPAIIYGPQSGFGQELMVELGMLVVTVLAAVILLPAVYRLRPRASL